MSVKKVNKSTGATTKVAGLVNSEKVNTMYGAFPSDASASNKLVSDATADDKISDAIADKADKVSSATNGNFAGLDASGNLIDSGKKASDFATAEELADEAKTRAKLGAHNFVALNRSTYKPQYEANLSSVTDQTEDSVTVTSIAADYAGLRLYNKIAPGEYIVSYDFESDDTSYVPAISLYYSNSDLIPNGGNILKNTQRKITVLDSYDYVEIRLFITRASDAVIRTGTFRNLMFRLATDTDDTYQAFTKTNKQLTDDKAEQTEVNDMNNILGAKNVFSVGKDFSEWFLSSVNGTTPSDKAVSERITGTIEEKTSSVNITSYDNSGYFWPCKKINLEKNTEYKVTYGAVVNNAFIKIFGRTSGQSAGSTLRELTDNLTFNSDNYDEWWVGIYPVNNGVYTSFEQMMIRLASDPDNTYQPYSKTNQELTRDTNALAPMLNELGAKNFGALNYSPAGEQVTKRATIANQTQDSVDVSVSENAWAYLGLKYTLPKGTYKFSFEYTNDSDNFVPFIQLYESTEDTSITDWHNLSPTDDHIITFGEDKSFDVRFYVSKATNSTRTITFKKFMIRPAAIADDTYVPYAKTNQELTQETTGLLDNVTFAGAKNFFNYDAWKGVSITRGTAVFEDNGVTLTATENDAHTNFTSAGGYPSGANIPVQEGVPIALTWDLPSSSPVGNVFIFPNGSETGYVSTKNYDKRLVYTPTSGVSYVTLRFGVTTSGNTCHYKNIQVTLASNSDNTYAPYAKTNRELTEKIDDLNGKYILNGQRFIEVEQETGDTYAALFVKLLTAINTSIASLGTNERLEVIGLEGAFAGKNLVTYMYNNTNVVNSLSFIGSAFTDNWQSSQFYTIYMSSTLASNHFLISTLKSTPTFAYEMASATVPNGYKFALRCHVYKRLVTT